MYGLHLHLLPCCLVLSTVLDLDPSRLLELVATWTSDWAGNNWNT